MNSTELMNSQSQMQGIEPALEFAHYSENDSVQQRSSRWLSMWQVFTRKLCLLMVDPALGCPHASIDFDAAGSRLHD